VVLDEVLVAVQLGLIETKQVTDLIEAKPENLELVLTGRGAPPEIVAKADYVTEMLMIKHPYSEGVTGRLGIEY
jgi:cob(I)alamin adenosyltransferase